MDTDFTVRIVFLNTNCTNITNLFGTRMKADEHGFYRADGGFEHEICRRPTDQREVIARMSDGGHSRGGQTGPPRFRGR